MIELTMQVTGIAKKLDSISDIADILSWVLDKDNLYCSVSSRLDGTLLVECGGTDVASVYPELGKWIIFDGTKFLTLTQEEFNASGYSESST
jgi:hypothetical protein